MGAKLCCSSIGGPKVLGIDSTRAKLSFPSVSRVHRIGAHACVGNSSCTTTMWLCRWRRSPFTDPEIGVPPVAYRGTISVWKYLTFRQVRLRLQWIGALLATLLLIDSPGTRRRRWKHLEFGEDTANHWSTKGLEEAILRHASCGSARALRHGRRSSGT